MADATDITLETFKLWSTHALRVYLSLRKKNTNGNFDELAARAFCAWEEKIPVDTTVEQDERKLFAEYKSKLLIEGSVIPDPFSITDGWNGEKSMSTWPSIYITDIATYLNSKTPKEILHRLLNEYKEGKAYRYFSCEWVKEIMIHPIRPTSPYCIMKAKVSPSQSINNKPYDVWIVVKKDTQSAPGGEIVTGYCSCTAGMLGSCNHIAGVLFRIEHAVKTGMTKPASTSKACEWNIPKKTTVKPLRVSEAVWKKSRYNNVKALDKAKENLEKKNNFTPLTKKQFNKVKNTTTVRNELHNLLAADVPDSSFCLLMDKRRHKTQKVKSPPSLVSVAEDVRSEGNAGTLSRDEFIARISVTNEEVEELNSATIEQADSELWKEQRVGRLTASNFHRISTRATTLKSNESADPQPLVNVIMGYNVNFKTHAMKHGISLEPCAKKEYTENMRGCHKHFKSENSGLYVYKDIPYIAASADLVVMCDCCGRGLCEIKCPESIKDQIPTHENIPYLQYKNGCIYLKDTHSYYYQVQGQMGVMGLTYCDLFIYTFHGHLTIRIQFDQSFWKALVQKMSWFWGKYIFPELLNPSSSHNKNTVQKRRPLAVVIFNTTVPNSSAVASSSTGSSVKCKTSLFAGSPSPVTSVVKAAVPVAVVTGASTTAVQSNPVTSVVKAAAPVAVVTGASTTAVQSNPVTSVVKAAVPVAVVTGASTTAVQSNPVTSVVKAAAPVAVVTSAFTTAVASNLVQTARKHVHRSKVFTIGPTTSATVALPSRTLKPAKRTNMQLKHTRKRRCGLTRKPVVYLCGMCGKECIENPITYNDESIGCDACSIWVHFMCAGIPVDSTVSENDKWLCSNCR